MSSGGGNDFIRLEWASYLVLGRPGARRSLSDPLSWAGPPRFPLCRQWLPHYGLCWARSSLRTSRHRKPLLRVTWASHDPGPGLVGGGGAATGGPRGERELGEADVRKSKPMDGR